MTGLSLLFLPLAWIVTAAGRTVCDWLRLTPAATRLERTLIAYGLGLGLLAYGMLALGLLGFLYPLAGLGWVLALGLLGWRQHAAMGQEIRDWRLGPLSGWDWLAAALFALFGLVSLVGVYSPPVVFLSGINATEWDSLSYHLADPKIFLSLHRIVSLPWQQHSNFAFTTEMWYTLALMAHGSVPLAKLFHWSCAAGAALATYALGKRHLSPRIGLGAALLFLGTPLVFWEAGTAYIDLATTLFATLSLLAVINGMAARETAWLRVGAVLAGLALSTKATALAPLLVSALSILLWECRFQGKALGRALAGATLWAGIALLAGSPWYIKSWIVTGNPIFPYFYSVFGGRWWDAAHAAAYAAANDPGMGRGLVPAILLPWNLSFYVMPGHPTAFPQPFNEFPSALSSVLPVFLATLFFPVFLRGSVPKPIQALAFYALGVTLLWFTQTQFVRFLLPVLPVCCLLTAWVLFRTLSRRALSGFVLAAVAVLSLAWSLSVGMQLVSAQAPAVLGGDAARVAYLTRNSAGYAAFQYINTQLSPTVKVVLFGQPFGFYCDRPYLWGDETTYVVPPDVRSADDLLRRFHALGITHVLVDTDTRRSGITFAPGSGIGGRLYALTAAHGPPLYPGSADRDRGVRIYALPPG